MRFGYLAVVGALLASVAIGVARPARACGGGVVTREVAGTVGNAQRIVVSIHAGVTDVVTQIGVPETTEDYGALLPVPAEPTLDPNPVPASELDALDRATRPRIYLSSGGGGSAEESGCLCGLEEAAGEGSKSSRGGDASVNVSSPVDIGPVTAVVLSAEDGGAVTTWLGDNGFAIPVGDQALVDEYAGPGRYFIALKRNDSAATGAPTSIGVHFTLPMEHGELPLRFARLGAASEVTFTVFVAASETMVPAAPFAIRTLDELDVALLRSSYAHAVAEASTRDGGLGFVIEGTWPASELESNVGSLSNLLSLQGLRLARLTTILPDEVLTTDAHFTETYAETPPRDRSVYSSLGFGRAGVAVVGLVFLSRRPRSRRLAQRARSV
jgi:hypothetical protein